MMRRFTMAISYPPKIEPVKSGACRQTVRLIHRGPEPFTADIRKKLTHPGDIATLFTRKPPGSLYSPWDWRQQVTLSEVIEIFYSDGAWRWSPLNDDMNYYEPCAPMGRGTMLDIVRRDFIEPPTIEEWEATLIRLHKLKSLEDTDWEVRRW